MTPDTQRPLPPVTLLHDLLRAARARCPTREALAHRAERLTYEALWERVAQWSAGLAAAGLGAGDRVAVYLPKTFDTVGAILGTSAAGGVCVPINPLLKPFQVAHILRDCAALVLVTSAERATLLAAELAHCPALLQVVLVTGAPDDIPDAALRQRCRARTQVIPDGIVSLPGHRRIDADPALILYTSGSTGQPKGVVLSHRNVIAGALSVAEYLENDASDRLLAVLPFSFDYGLSQLTTAFSVGAAVVLLDYLVPRDVIQAVVRYRITGLAAVPPLWMQLAGLDWPAAARETLRYLTNSGGAMPPPVTRALRERLPATRIYLMYGLTEAFRSTYLPPDQVDRRPDSIGLPIPNAEILVVREDGTRCGPDEPGELVHRGALVALGYWNDPAATRERFRPAPGQAPGLPIPELAVWSGDQVRRDAAGFLYFLGRRDELIKTSGYRVSPTEVEAVVYASGLVAEVAAIGIPDATLGQVIVVVVKPLQEAADLEARLLDYCRAALPGFMVPRRVLREAALPRNPNGKVDRKGLAEQYRDLLGGDSG